MEVKGGLRGQGGESRHNIEITPCTEAALVEAGVDVSNDQPGRVPIEDGMDAVDGEAVGTDVVGNFDVETTGQRPGMGPDATRGRGSGGEGLWATLGWFLRRARAGCGPGL